MIKIIINIIILYIYIYIYIPSLRKSGERRLFPEKVSLVRVSNQQGDMSLLQNYAMSLTNSNSKIQLKLFKSYSHIIHFVSWSFHNDYIIIRL